MKKTFLFMAVLTFVLANSLSAQITYKLGHIDSRSLVQSLPESQAAQKNLEDEGKKIQDQLKLMETEYKQKAGDYMANEKLPAGDPKKWSGLIKADKNNEIQSLEQRINDFQQNADIQLRNKQNELFQPIIEKVDMAIKNVAKENKFTYIFDVGSLLYFSDESIDITSMVKAKLSIK